MFADYIAPFISTIKAMGKLVKCYFPKIIHSDPQACIKNVKKNYEALEEL